MKLRFVLISIFVLSSILAAQTFRGTILGTVTDPSGNLVAGASIKVRNHDTGLERTVTTSGNGGYTIPELPIGKYSVTVTQSGFQTSVTSDVVVDVATERRVDAQLKVGQVTQLVEVSGGDLPQIETTSNDLGGVLTSKAVEDLPINGRDYTKLIFLNPGVAGSPDQITDSPGSFGEFSMNGARGRSNNYLLDGSDMNDGYRNDPAINQGGVFATPSAILPIDAVSDMKVLSNFEPEYGRNAGAVVNIVTKSGSNTLHGDFFEYFRNDGLDARNYFDGAQYPKAPFHNNQFGGSFGGPIIKDKTFFFLDYEGQRESVGVVSVDCVPTLAQISTDQAAILAAGGKISSIGQTLVNVYPHNPQNYISGVTSNDAGCFDAKNNFAPDYIASAPSFNNLSSFIAKIDHSFNSKNNASGRYFFGDSTQQFPLALNATGGQLPGFDTVTPTRVQLVSVSLVSVLSTTTVNEVRFGWNRFVEGFFPQDRSFNPGSIGFCDAPVTFGTCNSSGLPDIILAPNATGAAGFFSPLGATSGDPRQRVDTNTQAIDSLSWKLNKHDLKFGGEFHRTSVEQSFDKYSRGRIRFSTLEDMLQMIPQTSEFGAFDYTGYTRRHTYQNGFGFYFQDAYHVTPHLVLNYGMRWDYYAIVAEKNHLFSDFIPSTGDLAQVGPGGLSDLYNPDKKDFSPRASIVWDITGKGSTVIRAGFGLFFDSFSQDMMLGHLPYPTFLCSRTRLQQYRTGSGSDGDYQSRCHRRQHGVYIPSMPFFGTPSCGPSNECDIFSFDRNIKTPYMENYNLNIQHQFSRNIALQVGYVGSQGHRLLRFFDINQPSQQAIWSADCNGQTPVAPYTQPCSGPGVGIQDFTVPRNYGNPRGAVYIFQENSTGKSFYHSLQTSLKMTNYHGFTSNVNYVWSKSLDNSSDGEDFVVNAAQPQNSTMPQLEKGPSNFNIPNRFVWIASYAFPKQGGSMARLKNGWGHG